MRPTLYSPERAAALIREQKIATLLELMTVLGTNSRRTAFRKLRELACRTSYSHRGRYYTLDEVATYDDLGLWSHREVRFSLRGTLLETAAMLVDTAESGYFVEELDNVLHVGTKDALRMLVRVGRLAREPLSGRLFYCSVDAGRRREQLLARRARLAAPGIAGPLPNAAILPDELRAAIVLFFGLLDEKQRRLYVGLEALKTGRGGDARMAEIFDLDVSTVARGRRELLAQDIEGDRIRRPGGGRKPAEKKRLKSSRTSKRS
jgi:hypothetical protein